MYVGVGTMKDKKLKRIYAPHLHWVPRGTGTHKDRDEVNRREFWVGDV